MIQADTIFLQLHLADDMPCSGHTAAVLFQAVNCVVPCLCCAVSAAVPCMAEEPKMLC